MIHVNMSGTGGIQYMCDSEQEESCWALSLLEKTNHELGTSLSGAEGRYQQGTFTSHFWLLSFQPWPIYFLPLLSFHSHDLRSPCIRMWTFSKLISLALFSPRSKSLLELLCSIYLLQLFCGSITPKLMLKLNLIPWSEFLMAHWTSLVGVRLL